MKTFLLSIASLLFLLTGTAQANCIAFLPAGWQGNFWPVVSQGANDALSEEGLKLLTRGTANGYSYRAQKTMIDNMLFKGCTGFIIAPVNDDIKYDVKLLNEKGISVVFADRGTITPNVASSVIATDNYQAGRSAASTLIGKLPTDAKIGVLRLRKFIHSTDQREAGFVDAMVEAGYKISVDFYLDHSTGTAVKRVTEQIDLVSQLDAFFTPNETTTNAALIVLDKHKLSKRPLHIGFDMNEEISKAIAEGRIHAAMIQDPYQIGYQSAKTLLKVMNGEEVEQIHTTPTHIVTKDNLTDIFTKRGALN